MTKNEKHNDIEYVKTLLDEVIEIGYLDYLVEKDEIEKQGKIAEYINLKNRISEVR